MEFFTRVSPSYKSVAKSQASTRAAATSGLSSLFGSLLGGATPAYKTVDGQRARAPTSSSFWSMFSASPSYKTVPAVTIEPCDAMALFDDDTGDSGDDENCAVDVGPDQIVVL